MIEIKAPEFPESIADGEIATWHVKVGEQVTRDQVLVDIETDKVVLEVVAPADGQLTEILREAGETILAEEVLAHFVAGDASGAAPAASTTSTTSTASTTITSEAAA
ncbi:MAG: dihydrolipoamide succinyltransferase, partial [Pseudomonadales bacterium]|nr:dihydrolipoamide succinyltransferase [Pseudomonadales bacterium]